MNKPKTWTFAAWLDNIGTSGVLANAVLERTLERRFDDPSRATSDGPQQNINEEDELTKVLNLVAENTKLNDVIKTRILNGIDEITEFVARRLVSLAAKAGEPSPQPIEKITLNMGVGEAAADRKALEGALSDMTAIAGQKPLITKARKSVAGFKIREGWPIGCKVTLRSERMYDFIERLVDIAIPRIRDFRGLNPKAFDGRGNFSMGITEQIVFAEIDYDKIDKIRGMDICVTTTAQTNEAALELLKAFKFPFRS